MGHFGSTLLVCELVDVHRMTRQTGCLIDLVCCGVWVCRGLVKMCALEDVMSEGVGDVYKWC